mgnify:CR=1 FL=1
MLKKLARVALLVIDDLGMASVTGFSFAAQASVMERNLTRYTIIAGITFFVTTFLTVFGYILVFERTARVKGFLVALGWVGLLYVAFQTTLHIWFPEGLLM